MISARQGYSIVSSLSGYLNDRYHQGHNEVPAQLHMPVLAMMAAVIITVA